MMDSVSSTNGFCDEKFAAVRQAFEANFSDRGEIGASVAIYIDGKPVVDLWGGVAAPSTGRPWDRDTMVGVFSSTKGAAAACIHVMIDRGMIEVDAPVAKYWPEFAASGKEHVTVGMVLSHQAGLPYWQIELPKDGLFDWTLATDALAQQAPVWEPGTCHGYHGTTIGHLEGELVRRITGMTIGTFLRKEIADPLDADVWIGLPESEEHRVAEVILAGFDPTSAMYAKLMAEPEWAAWKMVKNDGGFFSTPNINSRAGHAAEVPAAGGIANARGLARLYAPFSRDGSVDGIRIVKHTALPGMRTVRSASSCDLMLWLPTTFTLGLSKSWGSRSRGPGNYVIIGEHAFGTPGMGGSIGFADGEAQMSFGYVMNRHGGGVGLNDRGQSLIDAAYKSLGFGSSDPGFWVR